MTEKITTEQYSQMWLDFQAGKITEAEWTEFAVRMWRQSIEENIDVLQRLAQR